MKRAEIIMPAFNAEKFIREAIESVIQQSYKDWALTIVDDGSTDNTRIIINEYVNMFPEQIRCFVHEKNSGTVSALNTALKNVMHRYICWLSADDVYKKDMLKSSIEFLESNTQYEAVFSRCEYIDAESNFCKECNPIKYIKELKLTNSVQPYKNMFLYSTTFHGCSLLGKIEVFQRTGLFNKDFLYAHDCDYWMRLASDTRIGFIDVVNVQGRIHDKQVSNIGKNDMDAVRVFVEMFRQNRSCFNRLAQKAGLGVKDISALVEGVNSRFRYYCLRTNELFTLVRSLESLLNEHTGLTENEKQKFLDSHILEIGNLILDNPSLKETCFFDEDSERNYLWWLCKSLCLDGFVINNMGIRFDKYNERNDIQRLCKGLERDNNIWVLEITKEHLHKFLECHKTELKYHIVSLSPKDVLKIGISEFMVNDPSFQMHLAMQNASDLHITIWQAFFNLILENKDELLL